MSLSNLQFLSPDSLCYSFDHRANGYSRGEGFGVIVLKPLSLALASNDTIRAVIRASSSNQDGRTPGITQPSGDAQALLIRETYEKAGLDLESTRFFEAHGTGTQIGDTTEAAAIHSVFGKVRSSEEPLIVGAVKSNVGHLEGASGLASIIKTVMALEHGVIPPNTNFEKPNPRIPVEEWNIQVSSIRFAIRFFANPCLVPDGEHSMAIARPSESISQLVWLWRRQCTRHLGRCISLHESSWDRRSAPNHRT
jgi:acyl transferase domain-containing protein